MKNCCEIQRDRKNTGNCVLETADGQCARFKADVKDQLTPLSICFRFFKRFLILLLFTP